jgi:predicted nucleotidyltransferase
MKQLLSQDAVDMLQELHDAGVRFLIVGGHALAVHGVSRATVDLDIFIQASPENMESRLLLLAKLLC